jgi:hypothetical protein
VTTTPDLADVKEAVRSAAAAIIDAFGAERVRVIPDGQGSAWVEISDVELGETYTADTTFVIFLLPFNLPGADVYPLLVRRDLERRDGQGLGEGFAATDLQWPGDEQPRQVTQVSRRTRRSDFARQTALQKVDKVLEWVRTR